MSDDRRYPVCARHERFHGAMFSVVTDDVVFPDGRVAARDCVRHVGAVAVVALDDRDRVVMVRQYRHPVGGVLWELPAGLVDGDGGEGESLAEVAHRELGEEVDLAADRLDLLLDLHPSPGTSDERIRVFLARGLRATGRAHPRELEEATMQVHRVELDEAVAMALRGEVTNAAAVTGLLAAARARDLGWAPLRPVDAPVTAPPAPADDG